MYLSLEDLDNGMLEKKGNEIIKEYENIIKRTKTFIVCLNHILKNIKYKNDGSEFKDFKKGFKSDEREKDVLKPLGYECFEYEINYSFSSYTLVISYYNSSKYEHRYENVYISKKTYENVIYCINKELKALEDKLRQYEKTDYKGTIKTITDTVEKFVRDIYDTGIYNNKNMALREIGYMVSDMLDINLLDQNIEE